VEVLVLKIERRTFVIIIIIVIIIVFGINILPQLGIGSNKNRDLEILHNDYTNAIKFAENQLEFQLFSQTDPTTYSNEVEGAIIDNVVKKYTNYIEQRYEYYKNEIKNADYSNGYRYDSEQFINDLNRYNPYFD
jgi:hypothetical protein